MIDAGILTEKIDNKPSANYPPNKICEQASSRLYHDLFLHMNEGYAYCHMQFDGNHEPIDYVFTDINRACRRLLGFQNKPVIGKRITELQPTLKNEAFDWVIACGKVAKTGRSLTFEQYWSTSNKWLSVNVYCPEKDYFAMIIRDISQRKKTEQALRQNEKQFKRLTKSITNPFFALDASLKFYYWNKASEKLMGVNSADIMGKHFFSVFGKDKATAKTTRVYLEVMRTKKPRIIVDKLPGCNDAIFEIQIYPTGNGISVFAKDVTENRKLQGSLQEYTKRLEELVKARTEKLREAERLAAIGETAGMVGHDIRNPLQSIIGELYLAKEELNQLPNGTAKENLVESISSIEEQTYYINKIVTDLQDYAKPLTPAIQETDLAEIIRAVLASVNTQDNIEVSHHIEQPFPLLKSDHSFMKRILTNLIRNAAQAMEPKGGKLEVYAFPREKSVLIAVSDTGGGIPDEAKAKIFKPLFTTKSKGQGFGLAVVKKLVDALGGSISFETKRGRGTTFILELPFAS